VTPRTLPSARRCARILRWLIPVLFACAPGIAGAATLTINIEGLKDELAAAARANLTLQQYVGRDVTPAQIRRLFNNSEREIQAALEPYGYYNVSIQSTLEPADDKGGQTALFRVTLGEPVIVKESKVLVTGPGQDLPAVRRAVRRFKPAVGDRLDHGEYEASKTALETALYNYGFLRAKPTRKTVQVRRKENTADIDVEYETGPRLKFGTVHFSESQFRPEFLQRYVPWKEGDYYSPDDVLALQQRLVDADYFATVAVQPDVKNATDTEVPINVELSPAKRTVYTAGVYVSTDTGPGVRVGMQRRWVNDQGHKFSVDIDNAQRLQSIATAYKIPLPGPDDKSLNFGATYRDENTRSSQSRTARIAANETRQWHGWTRSLGLQFLGGTFEVADERNSSHLLYAETTLTRKKANDFFFPRRGYSLALGLRFAPETALSDTSFSQATAEMKWINHIARRTRLLLRASLGAMVVDDFNELPPELRFFAGGDRSVRGFDYQQLGSKNSAGGVIGGTYLTVASAEIEHYFVQKWGAAAFVDGGDAFMRGEFNLNVGAGVGLRWRSPIGVVRLDVAKPVKSELAHSFRVHINIGPDL
jgi:translocation and assembly module TamA